MNPFIHRKARARTLGARALKRRRQLSPRQQRRVLSSLKDDAARQIRKSLKQKLATESPAEPPD